MTLLILPNLSPLREALVTSLFYRRGNVLREVIACTVGSKARTQATLPTPWGPTRHGVPSVSNKTAGLLPLQPRLAIRNRDPSLPKHTTQSHSPPPIHAMP